MAKKRWYIDFVQEAGSQVVLEAETKEEAEAEFWKAWVDWLSNEPPDYLDDPEIDNIVAEDEILQGTA